MSQTEYQTLRLLPSVRFSNHVACLMCMQVGYQALRAPLAMFQPVGALLNLQVRGEQRMHPTNEISG